MLDAVKIIEQLGVTVGILVILIYFIFFLIKEHKKEREEWRNQNQNNIDTMTKIIKDNTDVLAGIKSLLESIDRRIE